MQDLVSNKIKVFANSLLSHRNIRLVHGGRLGEKSLLRECKAIHAAWFYQVVVLGIW